MSSGRDSEGYLPIEGYAAIGDGRTVALVGSDGRIDWWPVVAPDTPPPFAAILDPARGGHLALSPTAPFTSERRYLPASNILETTFTTADGTVRVTDAVALGKNGQLPWSELCRRIDGDIGRVEMQWAISPGDQFGASRPWVEPHGDSQCIHLGELMLALRLFDVGQAVVNEAGVDQAAVGGRFTTAPGSSGLLAVVGSANAPAFFPERDEVEAHMQHTVSHWERWSASIEYDGPWAAQVRRSGLALRLLLYGPTGAIVAAPTTSLPERIGGEKNWDYRFMWVRDSSFTIDALLTLGLNDEAQSAVQWMLGALRCSEPDLHVFYDVTGETPDEEREVPLAGYRNSQPVRAGNGAATQTQLGTFGDLFDTIWRYVDDGHRLDLDSARLLADLADRCCDVWQQEDSGIWELKAQHDYTVSKIGCWTALDRAVRLHEKGQLATEHAGRWEHERDRVKAWVNDNCWSASKQSYTFFAGTEDLDAATLLAARTGFDRGERLGGTVRAIEAELTDGPMVYRFSGAAAEEGAFLACSFWLVNALVVLGQLDRARTLMDAAVEFPNDVGLLAEEIDPTTRSLLGNFPQGLSHLALINAACAFNDAGS